MSDVAPSGVPLPPQLLWLADAPLFIDANQVTQFYDAVIRPETIEGTTTLQITENRANAIREKLSAEVTNQVTTKASLPPSEILAALTNVFPFVKPELEAQAQVTAKGKGEGSVQRTRTHGESETLTLHPIKTPQRQLEHLTLHYLVNLPERLFLVNDPGGEQGWRSRETILEVPRALAFLDLPGQEEALRSRRPETKLIPTAAEFENGEVVPLFMELTAKNGARPEAYPEIHAGKFRVATEEERATMVRDLPERRKEYWRWFDENFSATRAMQVVERASASRGGIRWIDFRVPMTTEGDTLHLHVAPAGKYPTGTFAYNFIKRGFKHGLRLVGTLKSEPDLNVLAIYEK